EEGAEILRWWFDAQFPKLASQDWIALAQRTWREHRGRLVPDYDPKLARTLEGADLQHPLTLWYHFDALARVPLMDPRRVWQGSVSASWRGLKILQRRTGSCIAQKDGSCGSATEVSRSQPSFCKMSCSKATSVAFASRSGKATYSDGQQRCTL